MQENTQELEQVESLLEKDTKPVVIPSTSKLGNISVAIKYVLAETKKSKRSFLVGLVTVSLVVFSIALLQNTIEHVPVLFLKLSEDSLGEYDLVFTPNRKDIDSPRYFVNTTEIEEKIKDVPKVTGIASRWILISGILNAEYRDKNSSAILLILDTKKEKEINLGREWNHPPLQGYTAHVSSALLRMIGVKSGENITIRFDTLALLRTATGATDSENHFIRSLISRFLASNVTGVVNGTTNVPNFQSYDWRQAISTLLSSQGITFFDRQLLQVLPDDFPILVMRNILQNYDITPDSILNTTDISEDSIDRIKEALSFEFNLTVIDNIAAPFGKYPSSLGNVVVLEIDLWNHVLKDVFNRTIDYLSNQTLNSLGGNELQRGILQATLDPYIKNAKLAASKIDIREYSLTSIAMYADRATSFIKTKRDLESDIITWTNDIVEKLGINYPASINAPLIQVLGLLYYLRLFLDQLLNIVEIFLVGLGMLLIYSLLLADVDGKVYECGMLRALGMEKYTLIELLSVQSLLFSIPGICLGLLFAFCTFIPIGMFFESFSALPVPITLTAKAVGIGVFVGLIMPFVALIGPVQRALSRTLRDALDLSRSLSSDTKVTFINLEKLGLSPTQTYSSILAVVFGFVVYYLIPWSFIFFYWSMFFNIFVLILLAMVLGLALIGMMVHPFLQVFSVHLIMWGPDRHLRDIVKKNLFGHGQRNSKTAILFTICISFIIFAGTVFNQQSYTLKATTQIGIGADIVIQSFSSELPLDHETITSYLNKEKVRQNTIVKDFAFSSFPLDTLNIFGATRFSSLADYPTQSVLLIGVDRNFLDVAYDQFVETRELNSHYNYKTTSTGAYDVIKSIYDDKPSPDDYVVPKTILSSKYSHSIDQDMELSVDEAYSHPIPIIVSEAMRLPVSIDSEMPVELRVRVNTKSSGRYKFSSDFHFLASIRAMVSSMPGFLFSSYQQTASYSPVIISMNDYDYILKRCYNSSYAKDNGVEVAETAPRRALYVKLIPETTEIQREDLINGLRTFITDDRIIISDTKILLKSTDTAVLIVDVFFDIVALIVIVLCFFLLLVSFTTNVNENAWEFGVLRAIGMTSWQVIRVYVYESMAIVISSVILGFVIGDIVSVTLTLQGCLWSELPFTFDFPYALFSGVVVMSIIVAVLGSYLPARVLQQKKIATALKNM